jgi:hypothetical protein
MANEVDMGREKYLVRKVGRGSEKVEDHCYRVLFFEDSGLFNHFIKLSSIKDCCYYVHIVE